MSPTRTFSEYMTAEPMAKRGVKIFPLWRHGLDQARALARQSVHGAEPGREVVFARLVNDKPLTAEELAALLQEGIQVVPVSSRYRESSGGALQKAVLERLKTVDRLLKLAQDIHPPEFDSAAAAAVKEAYAKLPRATPGQRQDFLDEYYAADHSDNSVS